MYRRKLKVLNRNKLIVFVDQFFGIFPSHEVFMLANVPVHDIAKELNITREQVYAKYMKQPLAGKFLIRALGVFFSNTVSRSILISEFQWDACRRSRLQRGNVMSGLSN